MDAAVRMAEVALESGIDELVATPHVSGRWPNTASDIHRAVADLQAALRESSLPSQIHSGAEVTLNRALELPDEELHELCLGKGPWLLVECPSTGDRAPVESGLNMLRVRGFRILLSHPERCRVFQQHKKLLVGYVNDGVLCSVTAGALSGQFGKTPQRMGRELLAEGLAHNVASDAHDSARRPPGIATHVLAAGFGEEMLQWLAEAVPRAVLEGAPIPGRPATTRRPGRRWRSGLRRRG